jgi:DNA-binding transcriptional regulator LsrR (DeoR family)
VASEIEERLVALSLGQLHRIPAVIGVAGGGEAKCEAILGALRGHYIDVLITDMRSAATILERHGSPASPSAKPQPLFTPVLPWRQP